MTPVTADQIRSFILERYAAAFAVKGVTEVEVNGDFDLLEQGIIDSLGVLQLVSSLEEKFNIVVDLENLDAEQLTLIGPFCRYIEERALLRNASEDTL
jgi:acyl carrier protein